MLLRCCQQYAGLVLLVGRRLRRPMVGLSCCWMCWAVVAVSGRFRLFWLRWAGMACFGGTSPPSLWGVLWRCLALLLVEHVPRGRKIMKTRTTSPALPWSQRYMHNSSSCTSRCPPAFLSVSLVPIVCTPLSVAKPLRSSSVLPRAPYGSPGVLCLRGGALFVPVPAGQLPWLGPWAAGLAVFCVVPCFPVLVVCASVPQCNCRKPGWFGLVARPLLA